MKQYVLDEPAPVLASAPPSEADRAPTRRWPWRALLVLAVVEPLALGALYLALNADTAPVGRQAPPTPAHVAGLEFAPPPKPAAVAATAAAEISTEASRVAFERGQYVIDLRSADVGPALAMLAKATRATVHGGELLLADSTRLSRSAVASTPVEAWQAVFGNVANYAISCTQRGCAVWIAALTKAQPVRGAVAAAAAPARDKGDTEEDTTSRSAETTTVAVRVAAPASEQSANGEAAAEN